MKLTIFWLVVLSGFLLWVLLHYDFSEAAKAFSSVDWWLICLSFCFNVSLLYLRVFKWALILKPLNRSVSFYNMCLAAFTGYLFNMIIPARVGGLVQAWIIGRKEKLSISTALATITLVRILDSIMLVFLGLLIIILLKVPSSGDLYFRSVFQVATLAGGFLLFIIFLFFFFIRKKSAMNRLISTLLIFIPTRFKQESEQAIILFREGLECLNSLWYLTVGLLLSLAFWLFCGINVFILLKACGLEFEGVTPPYLILLAQAFSMSIPAPANAGPYHAATVTVLLMFGVSAQSALYSAIIMHGVMFSSNTLPGLIYICMDKTKIKTMVKGIKDVTKRFK